MRILILLSLLLVFGCGETRDPYVYVGTIAKLDVRVGGFGSHDVTFVTLDDGRIVLVDYILQGAVTGGKLYVAKGFGGDIFYKALP